MAMTGLAVKLVSEVYSDAIMIIGASVLCGTLHVEGLKNPDK